MKITVKKLTEDALLSEAVRFIFNRENRSTLARWYRSEHSPARTQLFAIFSEDTPYSVCMQMRTHDKNGALFLIEPGRPDTGTARAKSQSGDYRSRPRNMFILCNAQHLIDWSHKRLCMKAEAPTRTWFEALRLEVAKCDPELSIFLEPICAYRNGICAEFKSCGNPQKHSARHPTLINSAVPVLISSPISSPKTSAPAAPPDAVSWSAPLTCNVKPAGAGGSPAQQTRKENER